jgi:hypothetical protein
MPRLSKRDKEEWAFFIGSDGRRRYNEKCLACVHDCKQSFRAKVFCKKYQSKRSNERNEK